MCGPHGRMLAPAGTGLRRGSSPTARLLLRCRSHACSCRHGAAPRFVADRAPAPTLRVVPSGRRKFVVFVPDGCADVALDELDGRTPLEAARMPNLAALAAESEVGRARVIPAGLPPGSDVGNMAILGYDPTRFHTGRAPIEAAAMGVTLAPDEVAYRCNLVTLDGAGPPTMVDFAGGHPTSEEGRQIIEALDAELGGG